MKHNISLVILIFLILVSCQTNKDKTEATNNVIANKSADTIPESVKQQIIDPELLQTWTHFKEIVSNKNYKDFKTLSLDNLKISDTTISTSTFINKCFLNVFDSTTLKNFADNTKIDYFINDTEREYFSQSTLKQINLKDSIIILRRFQVNIEIHYDDWAIAFDFVKTKSGYKFFGYDSYGGPIYCH